MKLEGQIILPSAPQALWPVLHDPNMLAAILPGCRRLAATGEAQFDGELMVPVGPLAGTYTGNVSLAHIDPPASFAFTFTAQSETGAIGGNGRLQLESHPDGTLLHYQGEAQVGGQLADHAEPLLETNARAFVRQSLENLNHRLTQAQAGLLPGAESAAEFAVPNPNQRQPITILLTAALGLLALLLLIVTLRRLSQQST